MEGNHTHRFWANKASTRSLDIEVDDQEWNCEFTDYYKCAVLNQVKITFMTLALICNTVTLFILIMLRKYRNFTQRIFLYILVPNLGATIISPWNSGHMNNICIVQGFLSQITGTSGFLWIIVLTIYLAVLIIGDKNSSIDKYERFEFTYVRFCRLCRVVCWTIPILFAVLPMTTNDYGPAGVYCWITETNTGVIWRFTLWYGPVVVSSVIILIVFVIMYIKLYREFGKVYNYNANMGIRMKKIRIALMPFTAYAFAFLLFEFIQFSDRINDAITGNAIYPLKITHRIVDSSFNLVICAVFYVSNGTDEFTREKFYHGYLHHRQSAWHWLHGQRQDTIVAISRNIVKNPTTRVAESHSVDTGDGKFVQAMDDSSTCAHCSFSMNNPSFIEEAIDSPKAE